MHIKKTLKSKFWAYTALPFLLTANVAHTADTDVYLNQTTGLAPNVMFSLDTSGSMKESYATLTIPAEYVPATSYSGVFDTNNFYISTTGRIPSATAGYSTAPIASLTGCDFAVTPMAVDGFTAIRAAAAFSSAASVSYAKDTWIPAVKLGFSLTDSTHIDFECEDDSGVHGAASGTGGSYATYDGSSLYSTSAVQELDWDKFAFATIFTGNYLNYKSNPTTMVTVGREEVQNRVIRDAIKRTPDIVAGLARMYKRNAGLILRAAMDNSDRSNQAELLQALDDVVIQGATPLATTLLEVMHYYHGLPINRTSDYEYGVANNDTGLGKNVTDPASHVNGTYISPILYECQKNFVIAVTDGEPNRDDTIEAEFVSGNSYYPDYTTHTGRTDCDDNCFDEIAQYMSKADAAPGIANTYDLDGDLIPDPQTVKVYPIGMETQQTLLDNAALLAGTSSYYATDAAEFEEAFVEILAKIRESGGVSMVTASSSNNRFSKTANRDFLYYGQFVPSTQFQWNGNLKKYRFAYTSDNVAYITDSTATDPDIVGTDGSFASTSHSYWSDSADGNNALEGGVLDRLKYKGATGRLIKGINTLETATATNPDPDLDDTDVDIMTSINDLSINNAYYTEQVAASSGTVALQTDILNYAIGQDVHDADFDSDTSEQRPAMGGIVRSAPVAVQYGGTETNPDIVIFATTTDGVLHAFDDETGDELWAVLMPEAYPFLEQQHNNYISSAPWWGIDGSLAVRVEDANEDGTIDGTDKVYLYISGGMSLRRWFMIDVTNARKTSDQARLVRRGKYDANDTSWDELGLAISPMVPLTYQLSTTTSGTTKSAMIYANGWDPAAEFSYTASSMGRGLSLYDTEDGGVLWQMTNGHGGSGMDYAFATQPTTIDIDGDGLTDLIYAIDVNAQIWRFNVKNGATSTGALISGDKLATLGSDTDTNRRRAYKRIDAAIINTGSESQVLLAVGTGDRMNPLSTTDSDRLYVIRDRTAVSGTSPTNVLDHGDLYDATANTIGEGSASDKITAQATLNSKDGWYIDLPAGDEKSISAPLISSGIVNFPVYQVGGISTNPCDTNNAGTGVLYRMNVLDATPAADYTGDTTLTAADRFTSVTGGGIPGDAVLHTSSTGIKTIVVSKDLFVDNPDSMDPNLNATPDDNIQGDAAGYWFEERD